MNATTERRINGAWLPTSLHGDGRIGVRGQSEARLRFGPLGRDFGHTQSAVATALCRRTPPTIVARTPKRRSAPGLTSRAALSDALYCPKPRPVILPIARPDPHPILRLTLPQTR